MPHMGPRLNGAPCLRRANAHVTRASPNNLVFCPDKARMPMREVCAALHFMAIQDQGNRMPGDAWLAQGFRGRVNAEGTFEKLPCLIC